MLRAKRSNYIEKGAVAPHHHVLTIVDVMSGVSINERSGTSTNVSALLYKQHLMAPPGRLNSRRDTCPARSDHKNLHLVAN
jgi:hypothetical protein